MQKKHAMIYSAFLLTGANLLLRLVGMGFQVYLSGRIGAAGVGMLQLVLSVVSLLMTAAIAGIRTTTMYLSAETIGRGKPGAVAHVLSACFVYSLVCSTAVALLANSFAPRIASEWIGRSGAELSLRIFASFLPLTCLSGVMSGYFTAASRIKALTAVEFVEQFVSMTVTVLLLRRIPPTDAMHSCAAVVAGSSLSALSTLLCLVVLRQREPKLPPAPREKLTGKLLKTAVPLAIADDFRMGLSTVENLIIPKRLALFSQVVDPMASYGTICGMVFPVLMFPAALLFGLTELLIPEMSRCRAGGRMPRIRYLTARGLRMALVYGLVCGGVLFVAAEPLGQRLYHSADAGRYLRLFAPIAPMLYADIITDAMTKGMGQQVACVRYNIFTSFLDVVFLWILLPRFGIWGYYCSFVVTHGVNFCLSIGRLLRVTQLRLRLAMPIRALAAALAALGVSRLVEGSVIAQCGAYLAVFLCLCALLGVLRRADAAWLRSLVKNR